MKSEESASGALSADDQGGLRHGSSADHVYDVLKGAIASGDLQPGERITEQELASRFGVSRTPVRTALRLLEDQRLLEKRPGAGLVVRALTVEQLDDIYSIRSVLVGLAARLAAKRMSPRDLMRLEALQDQMESLADGHSYLQMAVVNDVFHDVIVRASRNDTLVATLEQIHISIIRYRHSTLLVPGRAGEANKEHRALLKAIREGNQEEAERVARYHVLNAHYARLRQQAEREVEKYKE